MTAYPRLIQPCLIAIVLCWVSLAATGCGEKPSATASTAQIEIDLIFTALWWSEDQMEGMDLSDAPPKQTEIKLAKWEASDPVGTPHPESFNVVALVSTTSDLDVARMTLKGRWGIGRLEASEVLRWTAWEPLADVGPVKMAADEEQRVLLGTVALDQLQENLYQKEEWPWIFEAEVGATVTAANADVHTTAIKQLEILAGD